MSQSSHSKITQDIKCKNDTVTKPNEHTDDTCKRDDDGASKHDSSNPTNPEIGASTEVGDNPSDLTGLKLPEYTNAIGNMVSALQDDSEMSECKTNVDANLNNEKEESVCKKEIKTRSPVPRSLLERRRVSLPEMTSLPSEHAMRIRWAKLLQIND